MRIAIPLVTMPYLSRALGSDALGTYSFTYTIALFFTYFVLLGLNQYGTREIAKTRDDKQVLSRTFWTLYFGQFCIGVVVCLVYIGSCFFQQTEIRPYSFIWIIWIIAEIADISWFFFGLEEFKIISIRNIVIRLLVLLGIFIFVHNAFDLWIYCTLQAVAFFMNSAVLWWLAKSRLSYIRPKAREVMRHILPSLVLFAPVIAISCYTQLNKIILGGFTDMSQVAYYDNADKIIVIPLMLIQSLGVVLLPRMSNVVSKGDGKSVLSYISDSFWISLVMSFGLMFGIAGVSKEFVPVFFGPGYEPCIQLMSVLSLIIPICAVSSVLGNQYLISHEKDCQYLCSVLFGAILNIMLCIALIPRHASIGAAVATVAAEFAVSFIQGCFVRRELPLRKFFLQIAPFFLFGFVELALIRAIACLPIEGVMLLGLEICAGGLSYVIISLAYMIVRKDNHLHLFRFKRAMKEESDAGSL